MILTGEQIKNSGIVNFGVLDSQQVQQVSVDLHVAEISKIVDTGAIFVDKTKASKTKLLKPNKKGIYVLKKGVYDVKFCESIVLPDNVAAYIKPRSSVVRCGGFVFSGIYDPGYKSKNLGCFLFVTNKKMILQKNCRLATIQLDIVDKVENTYNGQWLDK